MVDLLAGKTAVVTGGASGNGRAISAAFAEAGADVVVADLREDPREGGTPTPELVREAGSEARFVECDVTDLGSLEAAVEAADEFGGRESRYDSRAHQNSTSSEDGVDAMVNNAGVFRSEAFLEVTPEAYERLMAVNVRGVFSGRSTPPGGWSRPAAAGR